MLEKEIKSAVKNEILRIALFVIYYILLIALGVAIILGLFSLIYHWWFIFISGPIIFVTIGLVLFSLMLGLYLIKPLFAFNKNKNAERVEVHESECPELFALIRDVAEKTACKMPRHVFLSPDVNACVFYDTSFWSIFFPIKKNLEVGLGLFEGTSVEEVKSVIAHEFGHFSQNSMKIGSTVYITNTILHNLIYAEDFWDRLLDKWCLVDTTAIRICGILTRKFINLIKKPTFFIYKFVQKGYLKLSRYMEYDADNIACQCVGTANFISAVCKIDVLSNKDDLYRHLLSSLIDEKKIVANYFVGKDVISKLISNKDMPILSYDILLSKPIRKYAINPRVKVEDVWSSHPSLEDRLANARQQECKVENNGQSVEAWVLIPNSISEKVSNNYTSLIRKSVGEEVSCISDEQLQEWMQKEMEENFIDDRLRPFFGKKIYEFDIEKATEIPEESPFTEVNANILAEFAAYIDDWNLLRKVKDGHIETSYVQVDGIVYNKKNIPLEKFRIDLDLLHEKVVKIYSDIFAYISDKCEAEKKGHFRMGFVAIFYAQHIRNELFPQLFMHRDNLYNELNRVTIRDEDEYSHLCSYVRDYESHLKKVISDLDLDWISKTFISEEYVNQLKEYIQKEHNSRFSIGIDAINRMFHITDSLDNMTQTIYSRACRLICDITKEILDKTTIN